MTDDTDELLAACCAAPTWITVVAAGRPYPNEEALFAASDAATYALDDDGLTAALAAHPRIGERASGSEGAWSSQEQAGMSAADADLRDQMAAANRNYEQRFDRVYLVCATGLSAGELLDICQARLTNDPAAERAVVLGELAKIARLRLHRLPLGALL
jgi:2-oxo-4-hydroxy-4-carboxy-5-ureidoimidazoline decarboxylase